MSSVNLEKSRELRYWIVQAPCPNFISYFSSPKHPIDFQLIGPISLKKSKSGKYDSSPNFAELRGAVKLSPISILSGNTLSRASCNSDLSFHGWKTFLSIFTISSIVSYSTGTCPAHFCLTYPHIFSDFDWRFWPTSSWLFCQFWSSPWWIGLSKCFILLAFS